MEIRLYDTKAKKKAIFKPINSADIKFYVCGPTVYDRAHIGNARPAVVFDLLFRFLRNVFGKGSVTYVRNFTDIEKLFPNDLEQDNYLKDSSFNLPQNAKYQIYFPDISNKNSVDEYLVFIASEKNINWLDKYTKKEDLKSAYIRENSIKYMYKEYTIYK